MNHLEQTKKKVRLIFKIYYVIFQLNRPEAGDLDRIQSGRFIFEPFKVCWIFNLHLRTFPLTESSLIQNLLVLVSKGPSLYYVRTSRWVGGPENGNFPLLYVVKMSLRRWVDGSKKPQNTLT